MAEVQGAEESRREDHGNDGEPDNVETLSSLYLHSGQQGGLW